MTTPVNQKKILLAQPMGFCAGVDRAIDIVERVLKLFDCPIFVKHEIVHNQFVINDLTARGVRFIESISQVTDGSVLIYSAHGVSKDIKQQAEVRNIKIFDATCPLVSKIHAEVWRASGQGQDCILVGHNHHPEVMGTMGHFSAQAGGTIYLVEDHQQAQNIVINQPNNLFCVTQTTLSVDETKHIHQVLKTRFPAMRTPKKRRYLLRHPKPTRRTKTTRTPM